MTESQKKFQETPPSIREELTVIVQHFREDLERRQGYAYPESAEQEVIALCELMQETPSEEDSMKAMPNDLSAFFIDQDGSETVGIIRTIRAQLEYAPEQQRPQTIRNLETGIAKHIKPDTRLSLSLLALLGVISRYRTTNRVSPELLEAYDQNPLVSHQPEHNRLAMEIRRFAGQLQDQEKKETPHFPFETMSNAAMQSLGVIGSINRPYTNTLFHSIFDFFEHYAVTLLTYGVCTDEAKRNYAHGFRKLQPSLDQNNANFLIYARHEQMATLFEGVSVGGDVFNLNSSLRYMARHHMDDLRSSLLIGYRADHADYPGSMHFQLAPQYIARYRGGNMTDVFYVTDQEYSALDKASVDAVGANTQKRKHAFQKLLKDVRHKPHNRQRVEYAFSEGSDFEGCFFDDDDFKEMYRRNVNLFDLEQIKMNNWAVILRNGFYALPHESLAKEDFFRALFPAAESFDPALYDEYARLTCPPMREIIEIYFGVTLTEKPLWAQRNFLRFLSTQGTRNVHALGNYLSRFGDDALISFLATEGDIEFGHTLVGIGNRFGKAANPLFEKYAEIARTAYRAGDYLRENFGGGATAEPDVQAFTTGLLARGKALLQTAATKKNPKELLKELETIDERTAMICAGVAAMKGQHLDLAEVKPLDMHTFSSQDMRRQKEITRMVRAGYEKTLRKEWGDNQKVDRLLGEFDARVNDPENKSRFYVILRTEKTPNPLIGSTVFTDTGRGEKFWSALFFETAYRGSGIYPSIIMQALEKESQDAVIRGKTSAWKDVATSYIEQAKFEGVRFHYDEDEKDGALIIDRPIKEKEKPEFPSPLVPFSTAGVSDQIAEKKPLIAFEADARDLFDSDMMEKIFAPLVAGYVLSRYTKDAKAAQLVFEYRG